MKCCFLVGFLVGPLAAFSLVIVIASGCEKSGAGYHPPTAAVASAASKQSAPAANPSIDNVAAADDAASAQPATSAIGTEALAPEEGASGAVRSEPGASEITAPAATAAELDSEAANLQTSEGKKKPFDPIEENGKYFEGWPRPKLALVITGHQDGYLEPCGCAGLENQKGGLSRRQSFFQQLAQRGWPLAAVDVGGLVRRFGKQAELQFAVSAEALKTMGYNAVGFGPADLRLSVGDIVAAVASATPADSIFVSANVNLFGLTPKVRTVEIGGMKIGITSVLGKEYQAQVNNSEVEFHPAAESLEKVLPELKDCNVRILLANATLAETKALAVRFPVFHLVVTADGADVPPAQPEEIGKTHARLIEVGHKGMYAVVVGFYDDPKHPLRFQRVALDSRFPNSEPMKQLMVEYQGQLRSLGWEGLGLRAVPAPEAKKGNKLAGKFVGAANCKACHEAAWDVWAASKHAHATDTLTRIDPPRQFDPECISCHATGWNPQENIPYVSGFESVEKTPQLVANSCENCHGPGAAHVAAEKATDASAREAARELLKLHWPAAKESVCLKCHDHDNSPEFDANAEKYWSEIVH
ncbi:MAG TPA: multiheme c-type cytochrome [Pirellulales bacterium]|nr:multiheme c-type cytochrome [Pirellulales bacterium]